MAHGIALATAVFQLLPFFSLDRNVILQLDLVEENQVKGLLVLNLHSARADKVSFWLPNHKIVVAARHSEEDARVFPAIGLRDLAVLDIGFLSPKALTGGGLAAVESSSRTTFCNLFIL